MRNVITIKRVSLRQQIIGFATFTTMAVLLARPDSVLSRIGSIACIAGAFGLLVRGYVRIDLQQRVVIVGFQIAGLMNVTRRSIPLSSVVMSWLGGNRTTRTWTKPSAPGPGMWNWSCKTRGTSSCGKKARQGPVKWPHANWPLNWLPDWNCYCGS